MAPNTLRTPIQALQFAVEFAQMDLTHAKPKDLSRVAARLDALLNPDHPHTWAPVPALDRAALVALQGALHATLTEIISRGWVERAVRLQLLAVRPRRPGAKGSRGPYGRPDPGAWAADVGLLVYGEPRDWLLYRVMRLLEELGAEKLQVCPAPDCGRLFFKVTRKEYCSTRCQSRIYMRRYREENAS